MPMSAPWLHKHCPGVFTSEGAAKNLMVKSVSAWKTTKDQKSISILYWGSDPLWDFKELAPGTNGLATWHLFTYYRGSYRGGRPSHAFVEDGYDPAKAIQEALGTSDEIHIVSAETEPETAEAVIAHASNTRSSTIDV